MLYTGTGTDTITEAVTLALALISTQALTLAVAVSVDGEGGGYCCEEWRAPRPPYSSTSSTNPAPSPSHRVTTVRHSSTFPSRTSQNQVGKRSRNNVAALLLHQLYNHDFNEEFLCKLQCNEHLQLIFKGSPIALQSTIDQDYIHNKP